MTFFAYSKNVPSKILSKKCIMNNPKKFYGFGDIKF